MELPEYYKSVNFRDKSGKEHKGYLEPPFGIDDFCMFFEPDNDDPNDFSGTFYDTDNIEHWEYNNK